MRPAGGRGGAGGGGLARLALLHGDEHRGDALHPLSEHVHRAAAERTARRGAPSCERLASREILQRLGSARAGTVGSRLGAAGSGAGIEFRHRQERAALRACDALIRGAATCNRRR